MTYTRMKISLDQELEDMRSSGLYKDEVVITSPQGSEVSTSVGPTVNLCANNYLGLANDPRIIDAAIDGMRTHGFGMASVRFICGTQDVHRELEHAISRFLATDDAILYTSCFDANTGLFETILGPDDMVISDELNHASIIDGIRLSKAKRKVFKHTDMGDLEHALAESQNARFRLIATDGVFSMHGDLAPLGYICDLADRYDALVMVDDSHGTGILGPNGRGTAEHFGVSDRIDIVTSTLGKALGGASGGFTAGRQSIVDYLRQRSRPYLFSNTMAPPLVIAALRAIELVKTSPKLRETLADNTRHFRDQMASLGFNISPGQHPIVPIMIGDEQKTAELARRVSDLGVLVVAFSFPVVPRRQARIRVQISADHSRSQLDRAVDIFKLVGQSMGLI